MSVEYGHRHKNALLFRRISADDYVASRCCLLNGLIVQGHILAQQAFEKELKSIILLIEPEAKFKGNKRFRMHNLPDLVLKLIELSEVEIIGLEDIATYLTECYLNFRYPDNPKKDIPNPFSMSTGYLNTIDDRYFYLIKQSPIPYEIKFRTGLYSILLNKINRSQHRWATEKNSAWTKDKESLLREFSVLPSKS